MSGSQIYDWLKRHRGRLIAAWYQPGLGRVIAPCMRVGERCDESQWIMQ